jgi:hypothetical protein
MIKTYTLAIRNRDAIGESFQPLNDWPLMTLDQAEKARVIASQAGFDVVVFNVRAA